MTKPLLDILRCHPSRSVMGAALLGALGACATDAPPVEAPVADAAPAAADAPAAPAPAAPTTGGRPTAVGDCAETQVARVAPRLEGTDFSTGVAVTFANGVNVVDYAQNAVAVAQSPGDAVTLCLVSIPENCPPGDDRGRVYSVQDHRQQQSYSLPDSQHMCGGA